MRFSLTALALVAVPLLGQSPGPEFFKPAEFEGRGALVLSSDKLNLTILTTGGAFASLILRDDPVGLSPLWNPVRLAREAGKTRGGSSSFGHFVCVDGFGPVSPEERAAGLPGHGEAHMQPWTVDSAGKQNGVLSVAFSATLPLVQEIFRRTVRLVDGESVVYVDSELENQLAFDRPVFWAEHATISAPFLEAGKTIVDMSARQAKTRTHIDEQGPQPHRLADFRDFTWPMAPGEDGQPIDLRVPPAHPNSLDHTTCLMDPSRKVVYVTALHPEKHLLFGYLFKREEYPWVQNWEEYPPNAGIVRGMEISTQPFDVPRREALATGSLFGAPTFRVLPAKSKIVSRFLFFYTKTPDDMQKIDDVILENGKLIVRYNSGKQLVLAASRGLD